MTFNISLMVWVAFALMLAWAVGAYSRLNRLRDQMVRSRNSMLKYALMYRGLSQQVIATERSAVSSGDPINELLPALYVAVDALEAPLVMWERDALNRQAAQALGKALDLVQSCIDALVATPDDLAGARWPQDECRQWVELAADIRIRRSRYNVHVAELHEAVEQMPASALARLMGLGAWGEV